MIRICLGVSLNSRATGIAVVQNGSLLDWRLHRRSAKAAAEITDLLQRYRVTHIALMYPHTNRSTLTEQCLDHVLSEGVLPVSTYSAEQLRSGCPPGTFSSKEALFRHLREQFPQLNRSYTMHERSRYPYWNKLLEAVACAHVESMK